jgi:hypothetical protein
MSVIPRSIKATVLPVPRVGVDTLRLQEFLDRFAWARVPVIFKAPAGFRLTPAHPTGFTIDYLKCVDVV